MCVWEREGGNFFISCRKRRFYLETKSYCSHCSDHVDEDFLFWKKKRKLEKKSYDLLPHQISECDTGFIWSKVQTDGSERQCTVRGGYVLEIFHNYKKTLIRGNTAFTVCRQFMLNKILPKPQLSQENFSFGINSSTVNKEDREQRLPPLIIHLRT